MGTKQLKDIQIYVSSVISKTIGIHGLYPINIDQNFSKSSKILSEKEMWKGIEVNIKNKNNILISLNLKVNNMANLKIIYNSLLIKIKEKMKETFKLNLKQIQLNVWGIK